MNDLPLNQDINYLQGQLHGQRALLLGLANLLMTREQFRQQGMIRLQLARDAAMAEPVSDAVLTGIDHVEQWLLNVT